MIRFWRAIWVVLVLVMGGLSCGRFAQANIYQWEYVNPLDLSQGKQPSTTLAPQGGGVNAEPGVFLNNRNLTKAYLIGADLTDANLLLANLTDADLSGATLANAFVAWATFHNATFAQADISGANFDRATQGGFSAAQLYSTASYQNQNLSGVSLDETDLTGWDLSSQDLSGASFYASTLEGVDLAGAKVDHAYFYDVVSRGFTAAQLYSTASYQAHYLPGLTLARSDLNGWDFSSQDLRGGDFSDSRLDGTDFTNAQVTGVSFYRVTANGFTENQFYSTASYQTGELQGVVLGRNDLTGWNLSGKNLAGANFQYAMLAGVDFTGADISGAILYEVTDLGFTAQQLYSTTTYQSGSLAGMNLSGNDLSGWDFAGLDLQNVDFASSVLAGADFTGANISGAELYSVTYGGFTAAQLYSTASYQAKDLRWFKVYGNDFSGWDFEEQNLLNSNLQTNMHGANLRHAYLVNAVFHHSEVNNLDFADLSGADARGAEDFYIPSSTITNNLILDDGRVEGVDLVMESRWLIRDDLGWDGPEVTRSPIQIHVEQSFTAAAGSTIEFYLSDDVWDSTIAFEEGIPVALGGVLDLDFAAGVDVAAQVGRTFRLFDWTGVTPTGGFGLVSDLAWDLTDLHSTGEVTLLGVEAPLYGDFNADGQVDAADYTLWRESQEGPSGTLANDPHAGPIGAAQLATWRANYGRSLPAASANQLPPTSAPEPSAALALALFAPLCGAGRLGKPRI